MRKTINIDLDGCVYPFSEAYSWFLASLRNHEPDEVYDYGMGLYGAYPAPKTWHFYDEWDVSFSEFISSFRRGVEKGYIWGQGLPLEGSVETLHRLSQDDFNLRIVTHRLVHKFNHQQTIKLTADWLEEWNVPYHEIIFQGMHAEKDNYAADFAIDDKPKNVELMREAGVEAVLLDRPWNTDSKLPRVFGWGDFYGMVTANAEDYLDEIQLAAFEMDSDTGVSGQSPDTSEHS